jgi:hypothetical protein
MLKVKKLSEFAIIPRHFIKKMPKIRGQVAINAKDFLVIHLKVAKLQMHCPKVLRPKKMGWPPAKQCCTTRMM